MSRGYYTKWNISDYFLLYTDLGFISVFCLLNAEA